MAEDQTTPAQFRFALPHRDLGPFPSWKPDPATADELRENATYCRWLIPGADSLGQHILAERARGYDARAEALANG